MSSLDCGSAGLPPFRKSGSFAPTLQSHLTRIMWHHSPLHQLNESGAYMVTAGTYEKQRIFSSDGRLSMVQKKLFELAERYHWQIQAWAIMANHYHFVATQEREAATLADMIKALHAETALAVNRLDRTPGRRVWFQYWDTHLTFEKSYPARLNYVHNNPVHHKLVPVATAYQWCSAGWFEQKARPSFYKTVSSFRYDRLRIPDDFLQRKSGDCASALQPVCQLWSAAAPSCRFSGKAVAALPHSKVAAPREKRELRSRTPKALRATGRHT